MTKISKEQALMLADKGFQWHRDIFRSATKHPTYYACEKPEILELINRTVKEND